MESIYSVHVSTAKSWRGGENQLWLLAKGLLARGQKVLVVAPPKSPLLERCIHSAIPVKAIRFRGDMDPLGTLRLINLLRRERPQVLHLHDGHAVLPGQFAGRLFSRTKLRVVAHRRTVFELKGKWKYAGRVDRVIAISDAVREKLVAAGIDDNCIRVVYSGLNFHETPSSAEVDAFREKHALPARACLIGHAAALTKEKRHADMIQALALVNEKLKGGQRPAVHLALAGKGDQEEALRHLSRERGLSDNVHFLGFLDDLRPLWASSFMTVHASEAEGLCTALIEAQAAGLPAVITQAGGMVEVVKEGETGVSVPVGDVPGLSREIFNLVEKADRGATMGESARHRMRQLFSAESMVDGVLKSYRELFERP